MLDQQFLGGLGNYLRSEILFTAGVDPGARARDLDATTRKRLARQILTLARRSLRTGGITNDPALARELKSEGWPRRRYRHHVFARAGEACHQCGGKIRREDVSGRRLYWCPECQRAGDS